MKKIGITCYPSVGGSGVIATELGMLLAERGFEVHFITSSLPFRLERVHPKIYFHEVEIHHYPVFQYPPYDLSLAAKMAEVVDREKLDILHVHYAMPHAISAILARDIADHPVKIITTLHGTDITVLGYDATFKKMIKHGIEQSDAVTAVSKNLVELTKETLDIHKKIHVIYNFVNEEKYYRREMPSLRDQYGIKETEKVVVHISNFRKVKRIEDVIYTFYEIQKKVDSKLILIGDGPECSQIAELVDSLDMKDKVLFLGKQKRIEEILSIADLKLLMSQKESFGLVLLEAMACGVPCIGTNVGGIPEVIDHGETGYLVELGDTQAAATYAINLLNDENTYNTFVTNALDVVHHRFHSSTVVEEYIQLYNSVFEEKRDMYEGIQ